jgi:hypothetical protein
MIYAKEETRRLFLLEVDKYGDSYTKNATLSSLKEAILLY